MHGPERVFYKNSAKSSTYPSVSQNSLIYGLFPRTMIRLLIMYTSAMNDDSVFMRREAVTLAQVKLMPLGKQS